MKKSYKKTYISICILMVSVILAVSLSSCKSPNGAEPSTVEIVKYSFNNLIVNPLLSPLDMGLSSIIQNDDVTKTADIPTPLKFMTTSDIDDYYKTINSITESSSNDDILATVYGEHIRKSDVEKAKAMTKLFASAYNNFVQSSSNASTIEISMNVSYEELQSEQSSITITEVSDSSDSSSFFDYMSALTGSEPERIDNALQKYDKWLSITDSQYLKWLIQNKVIIHNALKTDLSSDEEYYIQAKNQFDIINNSNKYFIEMAKATYKMDEEAYIRNILMPVMKEYNIIAKFETRYIKENNIDSNNLDKCKELFAQYVDNLVE